MGDIINFETLLNNSISLPIVKVDREVFLRSALMPYFDKEIVDKAILVNPAYAGISSDQIEKIANISINYETKRVSGISFISGLPGGIAMIGTIPADLAQYFAHILRILQKLIYLYGWQELFDENGKIDDETKSLITLFVGTMFGVNEATNTINKICNHASKETAKNITQKALTKRTIYPVVKKVSTLLGVKMTKKIFEKSVSKVLPVVGGIASGGITYITYKPMAIKLKNHLSKMIFSDVNYYKENEYNESGIIVID